MHLTSEYNLCLISQFKTMSSSVEQEILPHVKPHSAGVAGNQTLGLMANEASEVRMGGDDVRFRQSLLMTLYKLFENQDSTA